MYFIRAGFDDQIHVRGNDVKICGVLIKVMTDCSLLVDRSWERP